MSNKACSLSKQVCLHLLGLLRNSARGHDFQPIPPADSQRNAFLCQSLKADLEDATRWGKICVVAIPVVTA